MKKRQAMARQKSYNKFANPTDRKSTRDGAVFAEAKAEVEADAQEQVKESNQ